MAIGLQNTDNIDAPGGNYPYGRVKDNDGTGNGTPANRKTLGDFHQYFARLMALAGITPNGLPENSADGFQYVTALLDVISRQIGDPQSTDLNNLLGVCIANVNNAYTNAPSGLNSGHIIVSYIPTGNEVRQRVIDHTNGATWTRLFNGSWSAWVQLFPYRADWVNITLINGWASFGLSTAQYRIDGFGQVHLRGQLEASGSSSAVFTTTLPNIIASGGGTNDYATVLGDGSDYAKIAMDSVSGACRGQILAADYNIGKRYRLEQIKYWNT